MASPWDHLHSPMPSSQFHSVSNQGLWHGNHFSDAIQQLVLKGSMATCGGLYIKIRSKSCCTCNMKLNSNISFTFWICKPEGTFLIQPSTPNGHYTPGCFTSSSAGVDLWGTDRALPLPLLADEEHRESPALPARNSPFSEGINDRAFAAVWDGLQRPEEPELRRRQAVRGAGKGRKAPLRRRGEGGTRAGGKRAGKPLWGDGASADTAERHRHIYVIAAWSIYSSWGNIYPPNRY